MNYFKLLCDINSKYDHETPRIRYSQDRLEAIIDRLNRLDDEEFNLDKFLNLCVCIYNMQIFYDSNTRTMYDFIDIFLKKYNIIIDREKIIEKLNVYRAYFPPTYSMDDEVSQKKLDEMKEYFKGRDNDDCSDSRTYRCR